MRAGFRANANEAHAELPYLLERCFSHAMEGRPAAADFAAFLGNGTATHADDDPSVVAL